MTPEQAERIASAQQCGDLGDAFGKMRDAAETIPEARAKAAAWVREQGKP
jgi:hypothetical protein